MIMVDIYVPAVDKDYDFQLDPNVKIATIIEEISEMIAHKEHSEIVGKTEELLLCNRGQNQILPNESTLGACGISNGSNLLLI